MRLEFREKQQQKRGMEKSDKEKKVLGSLHIDRGTWFQIKMFAIPIFFS